MRRACRRAVSKAGGNNTADMAARENALPTIITAAVGPAHIRMDEPARFQPRRSSEAGSAAATARAAAFSP
jgi:hypothetical protein